MPLLPFYAILQVQPYTQSISELHLTRQAVIKQILKADTFLLTTQKSANITTNGGKNKEQLTK